ncbi:hypothetical protein D3C85_1505670 [compost metagenome]
MSDGLGVLVVKLRGEPLGALYRGGHIPDPHIAEFCQDAQLIGRDGEVVAPRVQGNAICTSEVQHIAGSNPVHIAHHL